MVVAGMLLDGDADVIEVWDGMTGEFVQQFDAGSVVAALEFAEDGGRLASGQRDGSVLVWDTRGAVERVADEGRGIRWRGEN